MIVDAFTYLKQTQRFLREQKQDFENPDDLLVYINRARREVAGRTQCIRRLTPISAPIVSASVVTGGHGYVAPVATITTPDWASGALPNPNGLQATALVQMVGGVVTAVVLQNGGDGYFQPQITISDANGPGKGATATLTTTPPRTAVPRAATMIPATRASPRTRPTTTRRSPPCHSNIATPPWWRNVNLQQVRRQQLSRRRASRLRRSKARCGMNDGRGDYRSND